MPSPLPGPPGGSLRHPQTRYCMRACSPSRSFLRVGFAVGLAFCALRVLPRRGPCPCARPLRRGAPAAASRARSGVCALASLAGPAPRGFPPGSPARPCAPLRGSCGARCRRCPGLALAALRAPVRSPLLRLGRGPWASRRPAGAPPAPSASRLRGRLAPAPGACAALRAACLGPLAPGALTARPRLRGLAGGSVAAFPGWGRPLPCAPPPRRPRWGLRGARGPFGWASPPAAGARFSRPSCGSPLCASRAPVRRFRPG